MNQTVHNGVVARLPPSPRPLRKKERYDSFGHLLRLPSCHWATRFAPTADGEPSPRNWLPGQHGFTSDSWSTLFAGIAAPEAAPGDFNGTPAEPSPTTAVPRARPFSR